MTIGEAKKTIVEVEFNFDFRKLDPETARLIAVGDKEIDKNGQVIGEILSLGNLEPQIYMEWYRIFVSILHYAFLNLSARLSLFLYPRI